jgi:DNA-binding transcriptional LysR family regulator
MDLADLRIFSAVVTEGSITRAAARLHRVQSNITTRIRQLEDDVGVSLFIRERKRLHLSPAGHVLLRYAERLLSLADEAREAVQDPRPRGLLRLGTMDSTAAVRLPQLLDRYHRLFPEVELELRIGCATDLPNAVLTGDLDAALTTLPIPNELFDRILAFQEEPVIVAPVGTPALGKSKSGYFPPTIITFEQGCPHRKRLEDWYARRGQLPARTIEMGSYHAMLGCVVAGMGIALLPKSVLSTFPGRRHLSIHSLPRGENRADIFLIWRKDSLSPNVRAFKELFRNSGKAVKA